MPIIVPDSGATGSTIVDFASLQAALASWLNRSDLTATIPDLIALGELRIYRDLRVRQMETAFSTAISSGVLAVPTGYREMKYAYVSGSPMMKLQRKDAEWIYQNYPTRSADRQPKFFAREAENFIFGPYPDTNYTVNGVYYKRLTALSDSNTSNWLITDVPDLILFASLCEAAPYLQDDARIVIWEKKYAQIKDRVQTNDEQEEFSGSPLAATVR
jgi:hypothetical protein